MGQAEMSKGKTVITYGTFDVLHVGHVRLLRRLKEMGDRLIVAVSTDEFNTGKGKRCLMPFEQRVELVESIRYVDLVIPEECWEQKVDDIQKHSVDIFAIGNDWEGAFDDLKAYCEVKYLPRTEGVSTTGLKGLLSAFDNGKIEQLHEALNILKSLAEDLS